MAKKTITTQAQTWWDIGVELSGAWQAGVDLALAHNASMTDLPVLGLSISSRDKVYNLPMQRYCHAEGVAPATAYDETGVRWQIFSPTFNATFK